MALHAALQNPSSAPPRRVLKSSSGRLVSTPPSGPRRRPIPILQAGSQTATSTTTSSDFDSPSTSQLLSAISKTNLNTALLAGKAFLIATCIVGVGACGLVFSIQSLMGVNDVHDFARRMRYWTDAHLSGLTWRINRAPENPAERKTAYDIAALGVEETWTWEEAEERLKQAYDQGGFTLWAKVALRELEAEARMERMKRDRELKEEVFR